MTKFVNRFVVSDHHFGHTNSWEKFKLAVALIEFANGMRREIEQ